MRKLVLLAALLSCGASAINLSEVTASDLCIRELVTVYDKSNPNVIVPFVVTNRKIDFLSTLSLMGFDTSKSCGPNVAGTIILQYDPVPSSVHITYELEYFPPNTGETIVYQVYKLNTRMMYTNKDELDELLDKATVEIWQEFIKDWKQSHP